MLSAPAAAPLPPRGALNAPAEATHCVMHVLVA